MFERFTEKAIKVIMLAQEEARRLGQNYVGTDFILLALIGEGTGIASKTLEARGVTLKEARIEVEKLVGRGRGFIAVEIPFTQQAKRLMEIGWQQARDKFGHNYVGTEHLLLGLIDAGDGDDGDAGDAAVYVLSTLGVNTDQLRTETIEAIKKVTTEAPIARKSPEAVVKRSVELSAKDDSIDGIEKALDTIRHAKECAIRSQEFELAAWLREKETAFVEKLQEIRGPEIEPSAQKESVEKLIRQFTQQADKAYSLAKEESRRLDHNFVGTEQILLGLIGEGHSVAAKALKLMGVNLKEARAEVEQIIGRGNGAKEMNPTPRAKRLIQLAHDHAKKLGQTNIGAEHLLLALAREGEGVGPRVLENLGCPPRDVRIRIMQLLKEDGTYTP